MLSIVNGSVGRGRCGSVFEPRNNAAGRGTEVVLACNILNQMTGLGRPMSYRIGR